MRLAKMINLGNGIDSKMLSNKQQINISDDPE